MSYEKPIPLVPGDDWHFQIQTLNQDGTPADLSGYTLIEKSVEWGTGDTFDVDVVFSSGIADVTASRVDTAQIEMGNVNSLTIKVQAPDTLQTTIIYKRIEGVRSLQAFQTSTYIIGTQGPVGINWRDDVNSGVWLTGTAYGIRDGVYLDGTSYRAIAAHTAGAANQPGVGANWHDFWDIIALGANEAEVAIVAANIGSIITVGTNIGSVNTVAGSIAAVNTVAAINVAVTNVAAIAAQIVTTASISTQIQTVATNAASVVTVAGSITGVNLVAANMAAILDAPNQAAAAAVSAANALTYSTSASAYNDQANAYQLLAASYASNASTVFGQLQTLLASLTDSGLSAAVIGAAKEIVSAVDVTAAFIYDTGLDSDGGIWRKRVKATSWFNEGLNTATRGKRTFFPKRALIVARVVAGSAAGAQSLTIYDLDDSTCPMWMVLNSASNVLLTNGTSGAGITSITAMNGFIYHGEGTTINLGYDFHYMDLINDTAFRIGTIGAGVGRGKWSTNLAGRNSAGTFIADLSVGIVSRDVKSVAAYVAPGTPIDPVRKLPTPLVAVGTAGGVSGIHWDGRIVNSTSLNIASVRFAPDGTLWYGTLSTKTLLFSPPNEYAVTGFIARYYGSVPSPLIGTNLIGIASLGSGGFFANCSSAGLSLLQHIPASGLAAGVQSNGSSVAYITSTYSTGYQVGAIRMALAESTADITSLVQGGTTFITGPELIVPGTWVMSVAGGTSTATESPNGQLNLNGDGTNAARGDQSFATVIGQTYRLQFTTASAAVAIAVGTLAGGAQIINANSALGANTYSFVAVSTTTYVRLFRAVGSSTVTAISCQNSIVATMFDDFSTYADSTAMLVAWPSFPVGGGGDPTLDTGRLAAVTTSSVIYQRGSRSIATTIGKRYSFSADISGVNGGLAVGTSNAGANLLNITAVSGTRARGSFVATTTTTWLTLTSAGVVGTTYFDNVRLDVAASDRSVAGNSPIVVGTVTRVAVATGAELAAYGGFSSTNYLDVPANTALDFGTGDFSFAAWVKWDGVNFNPIAVYGDSNTAGNNGWAIDVSSGGALRALMASAGPTTGSAVLLKSGAYSFVAVSRRNGIISGMVDGTIVFSAANVANISKAGSTLRPGQGINCSIASLSYGVSLPNIALPRLSATGMTPAQMRAMYAAEAPMFQPGAKCLLTGTDNVQGLSYDDGTSLLRAHKAVNGTDVFSGLTRIGTENMASENALGAEIAIGGDFANPAQWSPIATAVISGGTLNITAGVSGVTQAVPNPQVATAGIGKIYLVQFDISGFVAGGASVGIGGQAGTARNANGTYSELITATSTAGIGIYARTATTTLSIDNVSVREVTSLRLASNNHKGGSAANDNVAIFTDADAYFKSPSISLREAMDTAIGRAATPALYDRNTILRPSCAVTANATPTVIASFPMDKGEAGDWVIETVAREYGDPAAQEFALYRDHFLAYRPGEGNIAMSGTSTQTVLREVTASMAVTIQVNTTTQMIEVLATGVAAKNLEWGVKAIFFPVAQVA